MTDDETKFRRAAREAPPRWVVTIRAAPDQPQGADAPETTRAPIAQGDEGSHEDD